MARMPEWTVFRVLRIAAFFIGLVVLWEGWVQLFKVPDWLVPAPTKIAAVIFERHTDMLSHTLITTQETVIGFAMAVVIGVAFAVGIVHFLVLRDTLYPLLIMLNSFPKVAIAPLFVIWIGVGLGSKVANAFLLAVFPIVINAILGLTNIEPELLQLVRAMTRSRWVLFWKIRMPHCLPYLFAGCKIGISLAVIGAIVGEFISGRAGLGYLVLAANNSFNTAVGFAALVYLVLMSLVLYGLVVLAEKLLLPWHHREF
jgi:NitT/TauT family transport system permease protein